MVRILMFFIGLLAVGHADNRSASIVVDAKSGRILYGENENAIRYPASLTKKMTIYLIFDALRKKRITLKTEFRVSKRAAMQKPSKLWLKPNETISVRKILQSLIVKSANDSAVVIAEGLGGSVENFAKLMTQKAHALGMNRTVFKNPSGLNDQHKNDPRQYTTAKDMAILAVALHRDFPEYKDFFGLTEFTHKGNVIRTHNRMINHSKGIDGMKTGFALAPGYNITTTAVRYDNCNQPHRIFVVVMGGKTARLRDRRAYELIDFGFQQLGFSPQFNNELDGIDPLDVLYQKPVQPLEMEKIFSPKKVSFIQKKTAIKKVKSYKKKRIAALTHYKENRARHTIQYKRS